MRVSISEEGSVLLSGTTIEEEGKVSFEFAELVPGR